MATWGNEAKLNERQVVEIKQLLSQRKTGREIVDYLDKTYGITIAQSTVTMYRKQLFDELERETKKLVQPIVQDTANKLKTIAERIDVISDKSLNKIEQALNDPAITPQDTKETATLMNALANVVKVANELKINTTPNQSIIVNLIKKSQNGSGTNVN